MHLFRHAMLALLIIPAAAVCGCQEDATYDACPMTQAMVDDCDPTALTEQCTGYSCYASCMVKEHPQCLEGPCMLFRYRAVGETTPVASTPFCSVACDPAVAGSCPDGGACLPFLDEYYCVPKKFYEDNGATPVTDATP